MNVAARLCVLVCVALWAVQGAGTRAQTQGDGDGEGEAAEPVWRESSRGPVTLRVRLSPDAPRIGDALTLEIEAVAEPGVELLMPEFGEALGRFQIVDFVPGEQVDGQGRSVLRQRYGLQTYRSGSQRIPPISVEFVDRRPGQRESPEGADAYELLTEAIDFEVASGLAPEAPLELRAAKGQLDPRTGRGGMLLGLAALALLAAAVAPFAWRGWQLYRARTAQRSAYDVARAELDALLARGRPSRAEAMDPFFVELSAIVRRYLEARFRLRSPELTTEEFFEVMTDSPDLTRPHQQMLQDFLSRADLVKFAHHVPEPRDVEASISAVERFLDETRPAPEPAEPVAREVPAHG